MHTSINKAMNWLWLGGHQSGNTVLQYHILKATCQLWHKTQMDIKISNTSDIFVLYQVRSCEICGVQSGTEAGFLWIHWFPLPILTPPIALHSSSIIQGWYNRSVTGQWPSGLSLKVPQKTNKKKQKFQTVDLVVPIKIIIQHSVREKPSFKIWETKNTHDSPNYCYWANKLSDNITRINTRNTKAQQLTRSWDSSIHLIPCTLP
jgi:hypothetical protein